MTPDEIRSLLKRHVEYWNAGMREEWLALWPDDIVLEDPRGVSRGKQSVCVEPWDRAQAITRLELRDLFVLTSDAALVLSTVLQTASGPLSLATVEFYSFGEDSSVRARMFYDESKATLVT